MRLHGRCTAVYLDATSHAAAVSPRLTDIRPRLESGGQRLTRWYVAQTHPRKELTAVEHLVRQGFATFFPRFRASQAKGQRSETVLKPVFPGYVFVAFDTSAPGWTSINSTRGVRRLIGAGYGKPQPVPADAMHLIQQRCRGEIMLELLDELKPGDLVQINTGPLAKRIAKVECLESGERVSLLFEIMGSEQVITVDQGSIGPINSPIDPVHF